MSGEREAQCPARRVVITGMGAVTPLGLTAEDTWQACLAGQSGVRELTRFDMTGYTTRIAATVEGFDPAEYMTGKEARRIDRFAQFAVAAGRQALDNARLEIAPENSARIGVCVGSGIGGLMTIEDQHKVLLEKGAGRISPFLIPGIICNMGAGMLSITFGAQGPNTCITTACTTGTNSIGDAYETIKRGDADGMIAGGAEACLTPLGMAGFCAARSMSQRNDEPQRASRPFDNERDGFVMGEGAGVVILEELEFAKARGADILAEVVGYGLSGDAYHITAPAPEGEGGARSMSMALKKAGLAPTDIDYINAHGTSTGLNDKNETAGVKAAFGEYAYKIPMSSTKSMTGHLIGAAGAVEAIFCVQTIRDSIIAPTINYENPDPNCDLDYVPNTPRKAIVNTAMSNSFGFGGHNGTLIIKRYSE